MVFVPLVVASLTSTFRFWHAFLYLSRSIWLRYSLFHDFRYFFFPSIVDERGSSTDFVLSNFGRCPQISEACCSGCCKRAFLSWNSLEISWLPPKFLEIPVLFVPHTRELLRRELEHVSRSGGGGCESSRTLAPSLFLFRCFLFGRAISVFSERFFNRLRPKKKNQEYSLE